jgi:hypothetical protein
MLSRKLIFFALGVLVLGGLSHSAGSGVVQAQGPPSPTPGNLTIFKACDGVTGPFTFGIDFEFSNPDDIAGDNLDEDTEFDITGRAIACDQAVNITAAGDLPALLSWYTNFGAPNTVDALVTIREENVADGVVDSYSANCTLTDANIGQIASPGIVCIITNSAEAQATPGTLSFYKECDGLTGDFTFDLDFEFDPFPINENGGDTTAEDTAFDMAGVTIPCDDFLVLDQTDLTAVLQWGADPEVQEQVEAGTIFIREQDLPAGATIAFSGHCTDTEPDGVGEFDIIDTTGDLEDEFIENGLLCVITNTVAETFTLTIEKTCEGDTPPSGPFEIEVDGSPLDLDACDESDNVDLAPGTYSIEETAVGDAAFTAIDCDGEFTEGATATVEIVDADVTCTVINSSEEIEEPGETFNLTITKECEGDTPPTGPFDFEVNGNTVSGMPCGETSADIPLEPGTYTLEETDAADAAFTAIVCGDDFTEGTSATVEIVDEDVSCTVINSSEEIEDPTDDGETPDGETPIDIDNTNTNLNVNDNLNNLLNNNINTNTNTNENTQEQENEQDQDNTNNQVVNVDSSPSVNIDWD